MKVENMIKELIAQGYMVTKQKQQLNLPKKVFDFFYAYRDKTQEHMLMCSLDVKLNVIATHELTVGLISGTLIDPREVFKRALQDNAYSILLCHNHPSGNSTPSAEDIQMTVKIKACADLMQIELIDHVIVSTTGFTSIREESNIW